MPHQVYHDVDGSTAMSLMIPESFVIQKPTVILLAVMVRFNIFSDKIFLRLYTHTVYTENFSASVYKYAVGRGQIR